MKNLFKCQEIMTIQQEILVDFSYHHNYYKRIGIDLSRQTNTNIPQKINFTRKFEERDIITMFFIPEKRQKTILKLSVGSLIVTD